MLDNLFLGNQGAKKLLLEKANKFSSHAVLIYGDSGLGKMTLARLLTCRYVCGEEIFGASEDFFSENESRLVLGNIHPDVLIVGEESSIKVDDIRRLIVWTGFRPNQATIKVCILKNCETMTPQAANALLKTLEEPPLNTAIIMHCNKRSDMLPTILSRVVSVKVEEVSSEQCVSFLEEKYPAKSDDEIIKTVSVYGGNIGKCILHLENNEKIGAYEVADKIAKAIYKGSVFEMARGFEQIKSNRQLFSDVVDRLIEIMGKAMSGKALDDSGDSYSYLGQSLDYVYMGKVIKLLDELRDRLLYNTSLPLMSSWLSVNLWSALGN